MFWDVLISIFFWVHPQDIMTCVQQEHLCTFLNMCAHNFFLWGNFYSNDKLLVHVWTSIYLWGPNCAPRQSIDQSIDRCRGQGDVQESMPEVCGATQRHADASVTGTQACQTLRIGGLTGKPNLIGMVTHGRVDHLWNRDKVLIIYGTVRMNRLSLKWNLDLSHDPDWLLGIKCTLCFTSERSLTSQCGTRPNPGIWW